MALVLIAAKFALLASKKVRWLFIVVFLTASVVWISRGADVRGHDERPERDTVENGRE